MLDSLLVLASLAFAETPAGNPPVAATPEPTSFGELWVDAKVPSEVVVDGQRLAQIFVAGELRLEVPSGARSVTVIRNGKPEVLTVDVPVDGRALVVVGRTGTSVGDAAMTGTAPPATGPLPLEVRVAGDAAVRLRIDHTQHSLHPGEILTLELAPGRHAISVRSGDGTVIWATGELEMNHGASIMQLAEGRVPELTGEARFVAHGG